LQQNSIVEYLHHLVLIDVYPTNKIVTIFITHYTRENIFEI